MPLVKTEIYLCAFNYFPKNRVCQGWSRCNGFLLQARYILFNWYISVNKSQTYTVPSASAVTGLGCGDSDYCFGTVCQHFWEQCACIFGTVCLHTLEQCTCLCSWSGNQRHLVFTHFRFPSAIQSSSLSHPGGYRGKDDNERKLGIKKNTKQKGLQHQESVQTSK